MSNNRFPNFSKIILAILESKIQGVIGKEAVSEIKAPYSSKKLEFDMQKVCERAENRLIAKYPDENISQALSNLKISDLPTVKQAMAEFYANPTNPETLNVFSEQIRIILPKKYDEENVVAAATDYLKYVLEEMTALPNVRDRLQAISVLRMEQLLESIDKKMGKFANTRNITLPSNNHREAYTRVASADNPALILFLVDTGYHMKEMVGETPAFTVVMKTLINALQVMVSRSTKQQRIMPRYHVGFYTYNEEVSDVFNGIQPIDYISNLDIPQLSISESQSDPYEAFFFVEKVLKSKLQDYEECPPPLVCHISAKEYPSRNPESVAQRIKEMTVNDGNVLVENIVIDSESVLIPVTKPELWSGCRDENELAKSYARQLFRMSSRIPETYRNIVVEHYGYNLANGSKLLYPGIQTEMITLGIVMSGLSGVALSNNEAPRWKND